MVLTKQQKSPRAGQSALSLWTQDSHPGACWMGGRPNPALPGDPSGFHVIGQGDVMWPHVVLPLLQPNHAAEDVPGMHPHAHVDVYSGGVPHFPREKESHITLQGQSLLPVIPGQCSGHFIIQNVSDCWKYGHEFLLWWKIAALRPWKGFFSPVITRLTH